MSYSIGETTFSLSRPIRISKDGQFEECFDIILKEPDGKKRKQLARMRSIIKRAHVSMATSIAGQFDSDAISEAIQNHKAGKAKKDDIDEAHEEDALEVAETMRMALDGCDDEDANDKMAMNFLALLKASGNKIAFVSADLPMLEAHFENLAWQDQIEIAIWYAAFFGIASDKKGMPASGKRSNSPTLVKAL